MPLVDPILTGQVDCHGLVFKASSKTPYTDTFREMVRHLSYDIAEMPLATLLLAVDAGKPIDAMPVVLAGGGSPQQALLCLESGLVKGPEDLRGRRVGIRAYAQTTAVWVRGILQNEYGIDPGDITWRVTEDSHLDTWTDPANVSLSSAPSVVEMLRDGEVDVVISSPRVFKDATGLRTVIADAPAAAAAWRKAHGVHGINHVLAVRKSLVADIPDIATTLAHLFSEARDIAERARTEGRPFSVYGEHANRSSIQLMLDYAHQQGLSSRAYNYDDLFLPWREQAVPTDAQSASGG